LIAGQDHISRLWRYRWTAARHDVSLRRVLEKREGRGRPERLTLRPSCIRQGERDRINLKGGQLQGLQTGASSLLNTAKIAAVENM